MNDEETIECVRRMLMGMLNSIEQEREVYCIFADETNQILLEHIKAFKQLLEKAEKILERKNDIK